MSTSEDRIPPGYPLEYKLIVQVVSCSCGRVHRTSRLWKLVRRTNKEPERVMCSASETLYSNIPWATTPPESNSTTARCEACVSERMGQLAPMTLLPHSTVKLTPSWAARERAKLEAATRVVASRPKAAPIPPIVAHPSDFS